MLEFQRLCRVRWLYEPLCSASGISKQMSYPEGPCDIFARDSPRLPHVIVQETNIARDQERVHVWQRREVATRRS